MGGSWSDVIIDMASKYLQKFPVPKQFPEILHDFSREILREQPGDIILFAAEYFKSISEGRPINWNDPHPRAPKPSDYPRVKGDKVLTSHRSKGTQQASGDVASSRREQSSASKRELSSASRPTSQVSAKSAESAVSEAAKEYLAEVLESIFDKLIENQ